MRKGCPFRKSEILANFDSHMIWNVWENLSVTHVRKKTHILRKTVGSEVREGMRKV